MATARDDRQEHAVADDAVGTQERPTCPFVDGVPFDPIRPEQVLNPYPWLQAARAKTPLFYMPESGAWCVTRHEDVLAVLRDTDRFSSAKVVEKRPLPGLEDSLPEGHPVAQGLVNTDPPEHTRLRKLAQKAFTPRMVASYEPVTRALAEKLVDGVVERGEMDLIQDFSRDLTGRTITAVIGAPAEKADDFVEWSDRNLGATMDAPPMSEEQEREMVAQVVAFNSWLLDFVEDRRASPREDYASLLVHAQSDDGAPALSTFEVVRILGSVISAGLDTTSSLIGFCLRDLLESRERWERLLADREQVPRAIEEVLRLDGPIHGIRRDVVADAEIGGRQFRKGDVLYLSFASAQRDEAVFQRPDEFDQDRSDLDQHFAFGRWRHFCLGAPLARMEAKVALEVLLERIPSLRLSEGGDPQVLPSKLGAFLTGLRVEWDPRPAASGSRRAP
jgi:cytochrome P450